MRRIAFQIALPIFAALLFLPGRAGATIYSFVDENGITHYSNVPSDPQYRPILDLHPQRDTAESGGSGRAVSRYTGDLRTSPDAYDHLIRAAASRYQVDPHLVKAVIRAESNFDCLARSNKGALGLMQLMPDTATDMAVADPFDPQDNIDGGTRYLSKMLSLFPGNLRLALAAYNAGPARVIGIGQVPRIKETIDYIQKVQYYYQRYQRNSPSTKLWAQADYEPRS
jgi:soluble lytic murein transglycosylase-like protein